MSEENNSVNSEEVKTDAVLPTLVFVAKGSLANLTESEKKETALTAFFSSRNLGYKGTLKEVNPRLFEVATSTSKEQEGNRYLVATPSEYAHIRHTLVFDQLCEMDLDLLMEYCFQDMTPEEVKIIIFGILQAPEDTISSYTKNRTLSMVLNFEALLRDFISDEHEETSGVHRISLQERSDDSEVCGEQASYVITEAFLSAEDAEAVKALEDSKVEEETESDSE